MDEFQFQIKKEQEQILTYESFKSDLKNSNINFYINSNLEESSLNYDPKIEDKNVKLNEEELSQINSLITELNKAIQINININERNNDEKDCKEILSILQRQKIKNKQIINKNKTIKTCVFKPLKRPKKISLIGRVLSDTPLSDTQSSSNQNISKAISITSLNNKNNYIISNIECNGKKI